MKLSLASSYALRAVGHLAALKDNQGLASHEIAKAQGIPERFILKLLKPLVSAGVLFSLRGPHGGYRLARLPANISLLEVLEAVDGPIRGRAPLTEAGQDSNLDQK